jgi:hypothetical protein
MGFAGRGRSAVDGGADMAVKRAVFESPPRARIEAVFGAPGGPKCTAGRVVLPFPFLIAWDKSQAVSRFSCHSLVAAPLTSIYAEAAAHYGRVAFKELGLHLFGGCFNYRPMRGGSQLSTHAWGVAVDHDPERNQLRWGRDRARLAKPDAEAFWNIVEGHGAVSLGRARNFDWMHFQFVQA